MAISKAQLEADNRRGQLAVERGAVAQSARYEGKNGRVVIELGNGCEFAFPVALAEGLAGAPRSKLLRIEITSSGLALHWPLLDADFYVPGLVEGILGSKRWMREKGKKGGRPRDRIAA